MTAVGGFPSFANAMMPVSSATAMSNPRAAPKPARGLLIAVALLTGIMAFAKDGKPPTAVTESRLAPYVSQGARLFVAIAPHELYEGFRKTYAEAKSAWDSTLQHAGERRGQSGKGRE